MLQQNEYFTFISDKWMVQPTANYWSCSDEVYLRSSFGVPFVLRWLSYTTLMWVRSAFLDELSGRSAFDRLQVKKAECEEGSKVMRRYTQLRDRMPPYYMNEKKNDGEI